MKKLKKFAALLLVGVMALALLTACGGGGDGHGYRQGCRKVLSQKPDQSRAGRYSRDQRCRASAQ